MTRGHDQWSMYAITCSHQCTMSWHSHVVIDQRSIYPWSCMTGTLLHQRTSDVQCGVPKRSRGPLMYYPWTLDVLSSHHRDGMTWPFGMTRGHDQWSMYAITCLHQRTSHGHWVCLRGPLDLYPLPMAIGCTLPWQRNAMTIPFGMTSGHDQWSGMALLASINGHQIPIWVYLRGPLDLLCTTHGYWCPLITSTWWSMTIQLGVHQRSTGPPCTTHWMCMDLTCSCWTYHDHPIGWYASIPTHGMCMVLLCTYPCGVCTSRKWEYDHSSGVLPLAQSFRMDYVHPDQPRSFDPIGWPLVIPIDPVHSTPFIRPHIHDDRHFNLLIRNLDIPMVWVIHLVVLL